MEDLNSAHISIFKSVKTQVKFVLNGYQRTKTRSINFAFFKLNKPISTCLICECNFDMLMNIVFVFVAHTARSCWINKRGHCALKEQD